MCVSNPRVLKSNQANCYTVSHAWPSTLHFPSARTFKEHLNLNLLHTCFPNFCFLQNVLLLEFHKLEMHSSQTLFSRLSCMKLVTHHCKGTSLMISTSNRDCYVVLTMDYWFTRTWCDPLKRKNWSNPLCPCVLKKKKKCCIHFVAN